MHHLRRTLSQMHIMKRRLAAEKKIPRPIGGGRSHSPPSPLNPVLIRHAVDLSYYKRCTDYSDTVMNNISATLYRVNIVKTTRLNEVQPGKVSVTPSSVQKAMSSGVSVMAHR